MKNSKLFMNFTLLCGFLGLAFTFDNNGIYWLWTDNKFVAAILGIATITFGIFWYKSSKKSTRQKRTA